MELNLLAVIALIALSGDGVSASNGAPVSLNTTDRVVQQFLTDQLNAYRREVKGSNMFKMSWDPEVQVIAQKFVEKCSPQYPQNDFLKKLYLSTSKYKCGGNIGTASEGRIDWGDMLEFWYNNSVDFKYGVETNKANTGFYTAMIWAKSYAFGCAQKLCDKMDASGKKFYLFVCNFCPSGNLVTTKNRPYQLGKPCAACPKACDNGLCTNPCTQTNFYGNCDKLFPKSCKDTAGMADVKAKCPATCQCRDNGLLY